MSLFGKFRSEWNVVFDHAARTMAGFGTIDLETRWQIGPLQDAAAELERELKRLNEELSPKLWALPAILAVAIPIVLEAANLYLTYDSWRKSEQDRAAQQKNQEWTTCASHLNALAFK